MRKAYIARMEFEVLFTADEETDNLDEAAEDAMRDALRDACPLDVDHEVATHMPGDWTEDALCYGTHKGDMTAKEALEATPEYVAAREKLLEAKTRLQRQG